MSDRFNTIIALVTASLVIGGSMAQAATVTATYANIQTSDNVTFNSAGHVVNYGSNPGGLAALPVGKYFRFGIYISVTDNPNAASALWAHTARPQPADLGVGALSMTVQSTDPTGRNVAAVQGLPMANVANRNASTAVVAAGPAAWGFFIERGDVTGNTMVGAVNQLGSGQMGQLFPLFSANANATPTALGMLASPGDTWFTDLEFKVTGTGGVVLTPTIFTRGTNFWRLLGIGDPGDLKDPTDDLPPSYSNDQFSTAAGDLAINPPAISINGSGPATAVPEASSAFFAVGVGLLGRRIRRRRP
jgi:hypothetical protein